MEGSEHEIEEIPNNNFKEPPSSTSLRNEDLPALFWDDMPDNVENHPDMDAINAILDESTPDERAEHFKDMGNRALKTGLKQRKKFYLRQAIEQYTEGIHLEFPDAKLRSILFSNRAQANLLLGNNRNAMMDGHDAIRHDPHNIKGYFRAAKGALGIYSWQKCREYCRKGLEIEPENAELLKLCSDADVGEDKRKKTMEEEAQRQYLVREPARKIATVLLNRGWRLGRPQFGVGDRKPRLQNGEIRWPVLFFYPEASMQNDAVEDFGEYDIMEAHLDVMFGEGSPPLEWDTENRYSRESIEVYYLSHAAKAIDIEALTEALYGGWPRVVEEGPSRYGPDAAQWVRVDEKLSLGEILDKKDHVVPGVPVFFVLAKETPFRQQFLDGDVPLF